MADLFLESYVSRWCGTGRADSLNEVDMERRKRCFNFLRFYSVCASGGIIWDTASLAEIHKSSVGDCVGLQFPAMFIAWRLDNT